MDTRETLEGYFKFLRIVIKYALFALLAFLIRSMILFGGRELAGEGAYTLLTMEWMSSVCILLGYFTLTRSFALYDTAYRDRFFEGERSRLTFVRKAEFIFCTPKFWIELLVTYALVAIMPFRFGFLSMINVLSFYKTIQYSQAKLYIALIVFPLFFLINFLAYYSAFNWWILRYRKKKSEEKSEKGKLPKTILITFAAYGGGALMMPIGLSILFGFFNVLRSAAIIILFVILCISLVAIWYVNAIMKRKKLLRELKEICNDKGYYLSKVKSGYRSIFRLPQDSSFTIDCGENTYECKLICGIRKNDPMYLFGNGQGQVIHTFHIGKAEVFHFVSSFQYGFSSQHKKIVIINPIPKTVYRAGEGRPTEIDVGEIIGDYYVYNATGFLNALERDCLGR